MNKKFIIRIKFNKFIACVEREKGSASKSKPQGWEKMIVSVKGCPFSIALITKICKKEDGSAGTLYLATNDLKSGSHQIYEIYKKWWRIEEYHKSIKQNASLEKSATKAV